LDLSRFDAAPLIAFTATKETNYGTETDGRIPLLSGLTGFVAWIVTVRCGGTYTCPQKLMGLIGGEIRKPTIRSNWPDILRSAATMVAGAKARV